MKNYLTLINQQAFVSSLNIAEAIGYPHQNIVKMIRKHQVDLEVFEEVGFEIRLNPQGSPTEYALLNERQATLLLTYMRNKPIVKKFKIALVKQFYELQQNQLDVDQIQKELLNSRPRWKKILFYKEKDLRNFEIARILEVSKDTLRKDMRKMEACGLIEPPKDLFKQRLPCPYLPIKRRQAMFDNKETEEIDIEHEFSLLVAYLGLLTDLSSNRTEWVEVQADHFTYVLDDLMERAKRLHEHQQSSF